MITLECLKHAKFREDPFALVPMRPAEVWVKRDSVLATGQRVDLRDYILKLCTGPIFGVGSGVTEFATIVGEFGAGKSHTFLHVASTLRKAHPEAIVIYLKTVRVADKTRFVDLYSEIIQTIGKERFRQISERLHEIFDKKVSDKIAQMTGVEIAMLKDRPPRVVKGKELIRELAEDEGTKRLLIALLLFKEKPDDVFEWLKGGKGFPIEYLEESADLPDLTSDYEAGKVLTDLIRLLTSIVDEEGKPVVNGLILMVDQWDRLQEDAGMYTSVIGATNLLIRDTPQGLALVTSSQGDIADAVSQHGDQLQGVFTSPVIHLDTFDDEKAKNFLVGLFSHYRETEEEKIRPTHPFEPEALDELTRRTDPKLPRRLIDNARKVFHHACTQGYLSKRKITVKDIEDVLV